LRTYIATTTNKNTQTNINKVKCREAATCSDIKFCIVCIYSNEMIINLKHNKHGQNKV